MLKGRRYKKEDFEKVYKLLLTDQPLDPKYNDHPLVNRKPERELYIKPDWILIYKYDIDTGKPLLFEELCFFFFVNDY